MAGDKGNKMILAFKLSMPNNNALNGTWTGDNTFYARVVNFGRSKSAVAKATEIRDKGYFTYNFGDGWRAGITVTEVDAKEAARIRRKTAGFCGYEWMIDSIRQDMTIVAPSDRKRQSQKPIGAVMADCFDKMLRQI